MKQPLSAVENTKEAACVDDDDDSNVSVTTNLVYLHRYAQHLALGSEQKVEVTKSKEEETKNKKSGDLIAELPIEHQIYDLVNDAGSSGIIVFEVAERLGIHKKEIRKRIESLCSTFGMIMDKEKCKKTKVFRVWAPGKRNAGSANAILKESENVTESKVTADIVERSNQDQTLSGYDCSTLKSDNARVPPGSDASSETLPAAVCARPRKEKRILEHSQVLVLIHCFEDIL